MDYVYHFLATRSSPYGGEFTFDGIITTNGPIDSMKDYDDLKETLIKSRSWERVTKNEIVIRSLSLLHTIDVP